MSNSLALPTGVVADVEKDSLGGGVIPAKTYPGKIKLVYMDKSDKGAVSINIHFEEAAGSRTVKQTTYISNQAGAFVYTDKNGKAQPLPGYSQMNAFFEATTGKGIAEQETSAKTIKLYIFKDGKGSEQLVERDVFMALQDHECVAGILLVSEEKATKESNYKDGTGEYREFNEFGKWFDSEGFTATERAGELKDPIFIHDWKKKNMDQTQIRKAKNPGAAAGGTAGAPAAGNTTTKSLFA